MEKELRKVSAKIIIFFEGYGIFMYFSVTRYFPKISINYIREKITQIVHEKLREY